MASGLPADKDVRIPLRFFRSMRWAWNNTIPSFRFTLPAGKVFSFTLRSASSTIQSFRFISCTTITFSRTLCVTETLSQAGRCHAPERPVKPGVRSGVLTSITPGSTESKNVYVLGVTHDAIGRFIGTTTHRREGLS